MQKIIMSHYFHCKIRCNTKDETSEEKIIYECVVPNIKIIYSKNGLVHLQSTYFAYTTRRLTH